MSEYSVRNFGVRWIGIQHLNLCDPNKTRVVAFRTCDVGCGVLQLANDVKAYDALTKRWLQDNLQRFIVAKASKEKVVSVVAEPGIIIANLCMSQAAVGVPYFCATVLR